jgi:hypothetical protein
MELASRQLHEEQLAALTGSAYVPPLPEPVVQVLSRCCLCFLATTSDDSPHLSLMRFSFSPALDDSGAEVRGAGLKKGMGPGRGGCVQGRALVRCPRMDVSGTFPVPFL